MKANKQCGSKIKEEKELEDKPKDGNPDFPSFPFADFLALDKAMMFGSEVKSKTA